MNDNFYDPSEEDDYSFEDEEDFDEREDENNEDFEDEENNPDFRPDPYKIRSYIPNNTITPATNIAASSNNQFDSNFNFPSFDDSNSSSSRLLPNGYQRQDYLNVGFSNEDIEFWGLDQPNAPDPNSAGYIIADSFDGKLDGNLSWPFKS